MINNIITAVAGLIVGIVIGLLVNGNRQDITVRAVGDKNLSPKFYQVQVDTATASTYISGDNRYQWHAVTNNYGTDRIVTSIEYIFTALTTTSTSTNALNVVIATTSSASAGIGTNTNYLLNTSIATSTPTLYISSSTPGQTATNLNRLWKNGETIAIEANATTSSPGYFVIHYRQLSN